MQPKTNPLTLIKAIRDSAPYMAFVYSQGSCYKFYLILKSVYPNAQAYYFMERDENHVIVKIGDKFYDIGGIVKKSWVKRATPFNKRNWPQSWPKRNDWWCSIWRLVSHMERRGFKKNELRKAYRW